MDIFWDILDIAEAILGGALLALLALAVVGLMALWLAPRITPTGIASIAAVIAFFVLGWTQGNKVADLKLSQPVNWALHLRGLSHYPGVGEGACYSYIAPGWYERETDDGRRIEVWEVTEDEARRHNAEVDACRAEAHRTNRDATKDWANWTSILLLGTAAITGYDHLRRRRRAYVLQMLQAWSRRREEAEAAE